VVQAAFSSAAYNGAPLQGMVHWDFGDGTTADSHAVHDGSGASVSQMQFPHAFGVGAWTVTVHATDTAGNATSWTMPVRVYPALRPSITAQRVRGGAWRFSAAATGGDGALLAGHWTFADGGSADGLQVVHTFAPGVAETATLTVVDGSGGSASAAWAPPVAAPSPSARPTPVAAGGEHGHGSAAVAAPSSAVAAPAMRALAAAPSAATAAPWEGSAVAAGCVVVAVGLRRHRRGLRRRNENNQRDQDNQATRVAAGS
jgi:hypothetical protein